MDERSRGIVVDGWELTLRARPVGFGFAPEAAPHAAYGAAGRPFAEVFGFALSEPYDGAASYPGAAACLDALEAQVRAAVARITAGRRHPTG